MPVEVKSLSPVSDADAYFDARLYSQAWTEATADDKQRALNDATRIIDGFSYVGFKTSPDQLHEVPRTGIRLDNIVLAVNVIPEAFLNAQYEIAIALLDGIDPEREIRNLRVTSRGYSSVRTTYDPTLLPEHLKYGVPSALAWSYLSTYLKRDARGVVRIHRVS